MIGVAFPIISFPTFSKNWAENQKKEFLLNIKNTIRKILFLILPLRFLISLLRIQIVKILVLIGEKILRMENFGIEAIKLTSASLGIFTFGIFAQSLIPLLCRAFFSFKDTKTPVLISLFSVSLNISLAVLFIFLFSF